MLQSKEGSSIVNNATKQLNPGFFADADQTEDEPIVERPVADLGKLFPEIRPLADSIVEPTAKKMKFDEEQITEKLIKRYGENYTKMAKDIKINYLQWSIGQCQQMVKIFQSGAQKKNSSAWLDNLIRNT